MQGDYYLYLSVSRDEIRLPSFLEEVTMYIRRYVQIQVNGDTFYREKNVIGYYGKFLSEPLEPFEIVED